MFRQFCHFLLLAGLALPGPLLAQDAPFVLRQDFWDYTAVSASMAPKDAKPAQGSPLPKNSGWVEYRFAVPRAGWYTLWFKDWGGLTHELVVDGKVVYYGGIVGFPGQPLPKEEGSVKAANLPLTAGEHTLRLNRPGRVGFPGGWPSGWTLRAADGPEDRIAVQVLGHDVIRVGESLKLRLTGGAAPAPATCTVLVQDLLTDAEEAVEVVEFPAGEGFVQREVTLPGMREGVFRLAARSDTGRLLPAEFRGGDFAVVDVKGAPAPGPERRTLVADIDCVAQTLNGQPLAPGAYVDCNGASRIVDSPLGKYRESNDGTGPEATPFALSHEFPKAFSGFSYRIAVPDVASAYLLEVDYPDDAWRHQTFPVADFATPAKEGAPAAGYVPPGGGIMCGGIFPLSQAMQTYRSVFWVNHPNVLVGTVSQKLGFRAGAARIRVSRFDGPLPPASASRPDGRICLSWNEQADDWDLTANIQPWRDKRPDIVNDYVGLSRWVAVAAYNGMNGIGPSDVSYQSAYWRTHELEGFLPRGYDMVRLTALLCEKYGLKYIPNTFLTQGYFETAVLDSVVKDPDEVRAWSWQGLRGGTDVQWMSHNILHPAIQQKLIDCEGELADLLRDSPAFKGIGVRLWSWLWEGHWAVSSIYWGYGDWDIAQFSRDTGIAVPGKAGDPARFEQRFAFLTSPAHRAAWLKWRGDRLTDFYRRLIARVQGDRKDLAVYLQGTETVDRAHRSETQGANDRERLLGMGLDLDRLAGLEGFALLPTSSPGRGKCKSPLAEQGKYDQHLDPEVKALAVGSEHAWHFSPQYDEWGEAFPLDRYGVPPFPDKRTRHYVGTSSGAGPAELERLALVLADTDATLLMDGSFRINDGDRQRLGPWLAEFKQLPRAPFTVLSGTLDPVAVRYRAHADGSFYFYAVNREPYALTVTLTLAGAPRVQRLGTGAALDVANGRLALALAPFELIACKAPAGTRLEAAAVAVPPERVAFVRRRLVFAQGLEPALAGSGLPAADTAAYRANLEAAWQALANGQLWRARTALSMAPMLKVYERLGRLPEGQVATAFPQLLVNYETDWHQPAEPFFTAEALSAWLANAAQAQVLDSQTLNPRWRYTKVLQSASGELDLDLPVASAGPYLLTLGHVAAQAGPVLVSLGGQRLPLAAQLEGRNEPGQTAFPALALPAGKVRLSLRSAGAFGVYALKLVPVLRPLDSTCWSTIGPFQSAWRGGWGSEKETFDSFARRFPPDDGIDLKLVCTNEFGTKLGWTQTTQAVGENEDFGVSFAIRCRSPQRNLCYGATFISSPEARDVLFLLGTDWWANLWCNGELVTTDIDPAFQAKNGVWFSTFKPRPVVLHLKPGVNTLLVKNLGGSLGSSFAAWIIAQPNLQVSSAPPQEKRP